MSASQLNPRYLSNSRNDLNYRYRINLVIRYIQEHLEESLELESLASVAGFSPYHMHRLFAAFVGETMGEYIRRMRLGRAVQQLLTTNTSVTQIALSSGYQTPAAFTKAFRQVFHLTPTQVRKAGLEAAHSFTMGLMKPCGKPGTRLTETGYQLAAKSCATRCLSRSTSTTSARSCRKS